MPWLVLAILTTLTASFFCSLFEAIVLSTTVAEIEALKKTHARRGQLLEAMKYEIDATISSILTLNTIANSIASVAIGAVGAHLFGDRILAVIPALFAVVLLAGAEV